VVLFVPIGVPPTGSVKAGAVVGASGAVVSTVIVTGGLAWLVPAGSTT
jgi:hypothetical protein